MVDVAHDFQLPIISEKVLKDFLRITFGVTIPDVQVCAKHTTPWRAFCDAYFCKTPVSVWLSSRGFGGKSFLLAALGLTEAITFNTDVNILGGSGAQSRNVHKAMRKMWAYPNAPTYLMSGVGVGDWRTRFVNGVEINALTASQGSVRGPHVARLRLDECLVAETIISIPGGYKTIAEIVPGEQVLSIDSNGEVINSVVVNKKCTGIKRTIRLSFDNDICLEITPNHPIWTTTGWKSAGQITEDDICFRLQDKTKCISIQPGRLVPVYNLTIDKTHNFIANGIVVHNCDEMDLAILDAALGQPMATEMVQDQVVMSSTHQYIQGTMTEILKRAEENGFGIYQWCYHESMAGGAGWLHPAQVESKKKVVTKKMWQVEYELQKPSHEDPAIDPEDVNFVFDSELGSYPGEANKRIVAERYNKNGIYVAGADWARKRDWSIYIVLRVDVEPARLVCWYRTGRLSWPKMVADFEKVCNMYRIEYGLHDGTGIGDVVDGYLNVDTVSPFIFTGRARYDLISEYIRGIEDKAWVGPNIEYMKDEHLMVTHDGLYGDKEHLPDTIAAGALAWRARKFASSAWVRGAG